MAGHNAVRARRGARGAAVRWAVGLVVLAAIGVAAYGGVLESQHTRIALDRVDVSGCSRSRQADVLAAAALPAGMNIWLLDTTSAEKRIESLPGRTSRRSPGDGPTASASPWSNGDRPLVWICRLAARARNPWRGTPCWTGRCTCSQSAPMIRAICGCLS